MSKDDSSSDAFSSLHRLYFVQHGISVNLNGGYYQVGKSYLIDRKLRVAAAYLDAQENVDGPRPSIAQVGRECGVGWHYVEKVEEEILCLGEVVPPDDIDCDRARPVGPSSISMDEDDSFVLYGLYQKDPQRSLKSYVNNLFMYTGTIVSTSTVSRWFIHGFPIRGGLCKPNFVPYDKFRPKNIEKAKEYLHTMSRLDPRRIKYCDEKSLKGRSIFNRKPRRDVVTGVVPAILTDPDLRNTYSIIGICGIDRKSTPVRFRITAATVDADLFALEIEAALASGSLRPGDILVADNAANHKGKDNTVLEDWLWEYHRIFVLFLPARTPEWNPIELVWGCLEKRLENFKISRIKRTSHHVVYAAAKILGDMTHEEIESFYNKSGVFNLHGHD